jgi:mannitol/fructose-specific phosphotransferase system IIA component (Ntr-type)
MKSILDALQEGRLIELPEAEKERCLRYLGTIIEAIPDFRSGVDFNAAVTARESAANTAITGGWACPHGRVPGEGDLLCAIGWSPGGIEYGAPDGKPVHIMVMHYVPDSRRNTYLREISGLARAILNNPALGELSSAKDLNEVRIRLVDLLTAAMESALPEAKARMIQLEAKSAVSALAETMPPDVLANLTLLPVSIIVVPGSRPVALSQDRDLTSLLEESTDLAALLGARVPFDKGGYRIVTRSAATFLPDRVLYDCIAVKLAGNVKN